VRRPIVDADDHKHRQRLDARDRKYVFVRLLVREPTYGKKGDHGAVVPLLPLCRGLLRTRSHSLQKIARHAWAPNSLRPAANNHLQALAQIEVGRNKSGCILLLLIRAFTRLVRYAMYIRPGFCVAQHGTHLFLRKHPPGSPRPARFSLRTGGTSSAWAQCLARELPSISE
jgi:hypothetical protein